MLRRFLPVASGMAAAIPGAALAQQLGGGGSPGVSIVRVLAALLLCLAVAFAAALLVRRRGAVPAWAGWARLSAGASVPPRISIIESRRLSPHADLCLARCDGTDYLILCGASQAQVLSRRPAEPN